MIISSNSGPQSMYSTLYSDFPIDLHSHWLSSKIHVCIYFYEIALMFAASSAVFKWTWIYQTGHSPLTLPNILAFLVRCKPICKFCMCEILSYPKFPFLVNIATPVLGSKDLWSFQIALQDGQQAYSNFYIFFSSIYHFCWYSCSICKLM